MPRPFLARDIMVTKVLTLSPETHLHEAAHFLLKNNISGAPVVNEAKELIGMFSEQDMMTALIDAAYDNLPSSEIGSTMTRDLNTIDEEADLLAIVQIFQNKAVRRLQVVREGKLVGQLSRRDVIASVVKLLEPTSDHKSAILYLSALREPSQAPLD
jgi:predicted transcriptional regulator